MSEPIRVLVVDDDDAFALALTALLEADAGIDVVGRARHGAEGVELAERLRPDVVTMDLEMPVLDGVAATRAVVELGLTVVIVSGYESSDRIGEAISGGAVASLVKTDAAHSLPMLLRAVVHRSPVER